MQKRLKAWLPGVLGALCLLAVFQARAEKEDRAFIAAETAYRDGNYRKALSKLEDFVDQFPESSYCEQALYIAAESALALEKFSIARKHYDSLLREYPETSYQLRARFGRALCLADEGRSSDAVVALFEIGQELPDKRDRQRCFRKAIDVQMDRKRYLGALEALGMMLDDGGEWRASDEQALEEISSSLSEEELLSWEKEVRGTGGGGLALFLVLRARGMTEATEVVDPEVFLFADEYPDHVFVSRIEALAGEGLSFPTEADKIGVILPLSGNYRRPGSDVMDGINLALEAYQGENAPTLVFKDSEGDPEKSVQALVDLVEQDHVIAVVGPLLSANALPTAEKAEELRVPIVVLSQQAGVPQTGRYVFRNFLTRDAQVDAIVDYAIGHRGLRSFAIFYPATESGAAMAERFWSRVEDSDCSVTAIEPYDADETDFRKPLRKLYSLRYLEKGLGAADLELPYMTDRTKPQLPGGEPNLLTPGEDFQAVFVPDGYKGVSMIAPAMVYEDINLADTYESKMPVTLLGGAGLNHEEYVKRGGRYVRDSLFVDAFFLDSTEPEMVGFVQAFRNTYQRDPGLLEALGYDTIGFLADVLNENTPSRAALRRALSKYEPSGSVTGSAGFDAEGEMRRDFLLLSVVDDSIVQLYPTSLPEGLGLTVPMTPEDPSAMPPQDEPQDEPVEPAQEAAEEAPQ